MPRELTRAKYYLAAAREHREQRGGRVKAKTLLQEALIAATIAQAEAMYELAIAIKSDLATFSLSPLPFEYDDDDHNDNDNDDDNDDQGDCRCVGVEAKGHARACWNLRGGNFGAGYPAGTGPG